jgi:adenine deaminase
MARAPSSPHVLAVARGDEPADLLLRRGRVLSPSTREWVTTDLAVCDGVVAGWGPREAIEEVDLDGAAVTAGLVDAHMHLESTKLWIDEFVRTVLPLGTTAVAADPHEVANVFGIPGVAALIAAARQLPFTFGVCASSCVPASPFESPGAELFAADVATLLDEYAAIGVAEVMNFPGVIAGDPEMLARIATAGSRRVDGHAPGLSGALLDAYLAAGVESDHECTELAEAEEKRRKGMWIFIRQGSASQNLRDLIPTVLAHGTDHVALCSDDREPDTLLESGHLNDCVQLAVEAGVSEIDALVLATLNPAEYHGFTELGALGPGYQADILCFDTLSGFRPSRVYQRGRLVAPTVPSCPARWLTPRPPISCAVPCTSRRLLPRRPSATPSCAVPGCAPSASTTGRSPRRRSSPTRRIPRRRRPPGRGRTAPADGPDRTGLGAGFRPGERRPGVDRRPRCAQLHGRRRSLTLGTRGHGGRRGPPGGDRRGPGGRRRSGRGCWPNCRCPSAAS